MAHQILKLQDVDYFLFRRLTFFCLILAIKEDLFGIVKKNTYPQKQANDGIIKILRLDNKGIFMGKLHYCVCCFYKIIKNLNIFG